MEFVIVRYPTSRTVFIDGADAGATNERLRIEEGKHAFNLGNPRDYVPKWRRAAVTGTTSIQPLRWQSG